MALHTSGIIIDFRLIGLMRLIRFIRLIGGGENAIGSGGRGGPGEPIMQWGGEMS